jgi:hypothetical protein
MKKIKYEHLKQVNQNKLIGRIFIIKNHKEF